MTKYKFSILALIVSIAIPQLSAGRDSPFTRKGSGPRYWIAYEHCYSTDSPIPESVWKENIDWMARTMLPYGYDMVCNDGWIEAAQTINANGYITKYNSDYEKGFVQWAEYIESKGMKMGVYYNPMWMTAAAFDADTPVAGTSVGARSIAGEHSFNNYLHWVDVSKAGAKEWIQGYVNYFKEMGVGFLRIDFLENYERNYGTEAYRQALEWIEQAAGDDMLLSLVMPNCWNDASTELPYGDMIRIDDDCFDGDWEFVSGRRRGERKEAWPQFGNAFDGFVGFSHLGGHGKMILDGDFMRMNRLASDNERRFLISLMIMAGSPLAIADQYSTIRQHAWVYQNREMLELNDLGFVGKPLSGDWRDAENSSRWVGRLPCGDLVVGLFNREDTKKTMTIDFAGELGIDPGAIENVRDLWQNRDMEIPAERWSAELAPHECQILRIRTTGGQGLQAGDGGGRGDLNDPADSVSRTCLPYLVAVGATMLLGVTLWARRRKKSFISIIITAIATITAFTSFAQSESELRSPDGRLALCFTLSPEGAPEYSLTLGGKVVIRPSRMGFELAGGAQKRDFSTSPDGSTPSAGEEGSLLDGFRIADVQRDSREQRSGRGWKMGAVDQGGGLAHRGEQCCVVR